MSFERPESQPNKVEDSLGLEITDDVIQRQAESIFGKTLRCFKKWSGLGVTIISVYVGGEKLIKSENEMNSYKESVVFGLNGEDLKLKEDQERKIETFFGAEAVSSIFSGDMQAYFEKQKDERTSPRIQGFDDKFARYAITEDFLLYPKGWINGEVGVIEFINEFNGRRAGDISHFFDSLIIRIHRDNQDKEYDHLRTPIQKGVIEHGLAHANDWETDMDLSILERQQLLLSVYSRMTSPDAYKSDYYSSFNDGTKEGLYRSAKEYWAEICSEYFQNPQNFLDKYPNDFVLVDTYTKKNDPKFDIFNKDRGAFDTQTGKLKEVWSNR